MDLEYTNLLKCHKVNSFWKEILKNRKIWLNALKKIYPESRKDIFGPFKVCPEMTNEWTTIQRET